MVKVSDLIAEFLKEKEIDTVFGIIGSANSHIFDSINKLGYTKIISLHHEQACVMAMGAYFRASGKLSAALVTAGGGATNAITGIASSFANNLSERENSETSTWRLSTFLPEDMSCK